MTIEKIECAYDELVPLINLSAHPDNTNTHPEEQISLLADIIAYQGQRSPIVVSNRSGFITKGHGRFMAIKKLDWPRAAVDFQDYENEAQELADMEADNRIAELAERDEVKFQDIVLKKLPDDFNLKLLGSIELKRLDVEIEKLPPQGDENEVPQAPQEAKTRPGDIYQLGNHKLLCGDSSDPENIEKLLQGQKAELVFTDPPYRMEGVEEGSNQMIGQWAKKLGERIKHLCDFDPITFLNSLPLVFNKGQMNAYIFCNKDLVPDYLNWAVESGYSFNILFWKKPNAIPLGGSHRPDVEYLLLFRKSAIWNNAVPDVIYSKCLEFPSERSKDHPTLKPVELICNELKISSNPGGIVFEFFTGSGSTIIAAEKTGRTCYGIELDPRYCDVIVNRWEKYTGKQAVLLNGAF